MMISWRYCWLVDDNSCLFLMEAHLFILLVFLPAGESMTEFPDLVVFPEKRTVQIGSSVTFVCFDRGLTSPTHPPRQPMRWLDPDLKVIGSTSGRIHMEIINGSLSMLHVTKIRWSDRGKYRCTRGSRRYKRSQRGHDLSIDDYREAESRLSIQDKNIIVGRKHLPSQSVTAHRGSDVTLPCSPPANTEWFFGLQQIIPGGRYSLVEEGLHIKQVLPEDDGEYECTTGRKFQNIRLVVLAPPVIEQLLLPKKAILGQNVSIKCQLHGNTPVHYHWAKEQRVSEMVRVKKKLLEKSGELELIDVQLEDEGRYFCLVSNQLGSHEMSAKLRVLSPPVITSGMVERVVVMVGRSVEFVCGFQGLPTPFIQWKLTTLQGETIQSSEEFRRHDLRVDVNEGEGRIGINSVNKSLTGNVTCVATNEAGSSSRTSMLLVEHEPSAAASPLLQYGWSGEIRKFKCSSVAFPLATLSWFHDDLFIHVDDFHEQHVTQLSINSVESVLTVTIPDKATWIFGNYTCIAKNIHGHSTGSVTLVQAFAPEAPRNISILEEKPHEVVITGGSQGNPLQPISWSVSYEEQTPGSKQQREIFSFGEEIILKNLKASTDYTVYLSLKNAVGYGQPTKFKLRTPATDSLGSKNLKLFSNEKMHVSDASISSASFDTKMKTHQDFESKFSSMKKAKKKSNHEGSSHLVWAIATGLVLTVASSITTACFCTVWRQRNRKCQNASDILSIRGQINSPIPPNSILLVPVSNSDQNGQPILTNDDVETLASELASLSQDTPSKTIKSEHPFGTFPRHFKHSKEENLQCFSPIFTPASSNRRKAGDAVDIFGAQFRKIQPETSRSPTCNAHLFSPAKKAHNFMPIILDCNGGEERHSKKFIPVIESRLRKNSANESFATCGGYKSADNVDDDIESVRCNTPCHERFHSNRAFPSDEGSIPACAYHPNVIRSMSQLK